MNKGKEFRERKREKKEAAAQKARQTVYHVTASGAFLSDFCAAGRADPRRHAKQFRILNYPKQSTDSRKRIRNAAEEIKRKRIDKQNGLNATESSSEQQRNLNQWKDSDSFHRKQDCHSCPAHGSHPAHGPLNRAQAEREARTPDPAYHAHGGPAPLPEYGSGLQSAVWENFLGNHSSMERKRNENLYSGMVFNRNQQRAISGINTFLPPVSGMGIRNPQPESISSCRRNSAEDSDS